MPRAGLLRLDLDNPSEQTPRLQWEAGQPASLRAGSRKTTKQALPELNSGRQRLDRVQAVTAGGC